MTPPGVRDQPATLRTLRRNTAFTYRGAWRSEKCLGAQVINYALKVSEEGASAMIKMSSKEDS